MTPAKSGKALATNIAKSEVHILDRCGHMMMAERPNEMYKALRGLIF
jgi:pimeloyl-ACP methyl ester carboxylesterase